MGTYDTRGGSPISPHDQDETCDGCGLDAADCKCPESAAPAPADGPEAQPRDGLVARLRYGKHQELISRLLHWKHTVPTTRERAEMIEDMRDAADFLLHDEQAKEPNRAAIAQTKVAK